MTHHLKGISGVFLLITPTELEEGVDLIERCPKGKNRNVSLFLVDIGYTHKLELNLQLSVNWTSSDINLTVNVPNVMGVVNQILFREGAGFYTLHGVQIFPISLK